jgi:Peptidase family M23
MPRARFMNNAGSPASRARWCNLRVLMLIMPMWLTLAQAADYIRCPLADGFDFPVGKPDAAGYYKARGFYPNGHLGEDWNGRGGGDSDLGDPIYSMGGGVVVLSENVGVGWGNVVIVRHAFRDATGKIDMVDSLYGHLHQRNVKLHQLVERGQQVGTMGGNNGMYYVHLHFEVRKNLKIGMNRSSFARDYSNYYSPTQFINANRRLSASLQKFEVPVNTFAAYGKDLSDIDRSATKGGLTIPVFPSGAVGGMPGLVLTPRGGKAPDAGTSSSSGETPAAPVGSSKREPPPPPPTTGDEGDFWSRLKSKLKQGKVTDESPSGSR